MSTAAQIAANRRNAQKSTGPTTGDGKARTRQNALVHGLCACVPLMSDEKIEEIEELLATLREEHQPVGATEEILVYKMAEHFWFGKRASYLLAEKLDWADQSPNEVNANTREISLLLRYHTTADRGYYKALSELRKIQKERRLQEIGSVSQNAGEPPLAEPKPVLIIPEITPEPAEFAAPAVKSPEIIPTDAFRALKKAA